MNTQYTNASAYDQFIDSLNEDNFFDIMYMEVRFDMKQVEKNDNLEKETCMICLEDIDNKTVAYKCVKCSCHLHHKCLNNYAKSCIITNCIQCKHLNPSVYDNIEF